MVFVLISRIEFVDSFLLKISLDIFAFFETNLNSSMDINGYSVACYLPFGWKDSMINMADFGASTGKKVSITRELSIDIPGDSFMFFRFSLLYSVSYHFSPYSFLSFQYCDILNNISDNIELPLSLYPHSYTNIFLFIVYIIYPVNCLNHSSVINFVSIQTFNFSVFQLNIGFPF